MALASIQEASERELGSEFVHTVRFHLVQGTAAGFSVEVAPGSAGSAIPVKISLPPLSGEAEGARTIRRFLMFRGIPENLTLSSGFRTRNSWIVASGDAPGLRMNVPSDYSGSFAFEVILHRGEKDAPERRVIAVHISPPAQPGPPPQQSAGGAPGNATIVPANEAELISQGENHLRNGNVVFARAVFEELASRGSARGAFAVAQTYDSAVLEQIGAVGIQGDAEQAKYWYRRAAELGNTPQLDILSALKKERSPQ